MFVLLRRARRARAAREVMPPPYPLPDFGEKIAKNSV
jgi:hypothetical protein